MKERTKAIRIGNSIGIIIPNYIAKVLDIQKSTKVDLELNLEKRRIEIKAISE